MPGDLAAALLADAIMATAKTLLATPEPKARFHEVGEEFLRFLFHGLDPSASRVADRPARWQAAKVTGSHVPDDPDLLDLLENLDLPGDLGGLDPDQLAVLADAIRRYLVEVMSETGGHLSPNLGVVELTLALHRVFASPDDAIIWDVGHQAYVHKILTGRADRFPTLRQDGGLSGYPSREESPHDWVENSHASTSLSYGMGMATAGRKGSTVVVIGDGALTGGMAHEALNHIAHSRPARLVIVLNDNGRSYAPTVGGLARHLARLRLDPHYESTKRAIGSRLRRIPGIGEFADETARRIKESIKQMLSPSTFFDVLELKYAGPIDGHDLALLERTLARAKGFDEPVVIHVVTDKGKGYQPAIADERDKLHGVGRFDVATGEPMLRQIIVHRRVRDGAGRRRPSPSRGGGGDGGHGVVHRSRGHGGGLSRSGSTTSASRNSTRSPSPPGWPWRDFTRWCASTPPSCSAPSTR